MGFELKLRDIDCEGEYVSNEKGIGKNYQAWNKWRPVIIDAPTGSGKNTFVLEVLAPYASETGKCVLLVSNRTALNQQQKRVLWNRQRKMHIASSDLANEYCFGNILVLSYQQILNFIFNPNRPLAQFDIGYVVFDEAHFFLSDARFNSSTDLILKSMISNFCDAVRIYMSATPQEVQDTIWWCEQKLLAEKLDPNFNQNFTAAQIAILVPANKPELTIYHFKPSYECCSFNFFDDWESLAGCIAESHAEEKWLIFVQRKSEFAQIKESLKGTIDKSDIEFIDSTQKSGSTYEQITRNRRFDARILVSTTVLDNGVSFEDSSLKHVVMQSLDPVSTVQMAGRKRRDSDQQTNFYFKTATLNEVQQFYQSTNKLIALVDEYRSNPLEWFISRRWGDLSEQAQKLFRASAVGYALQTPGYNPGDHPIQYYQMPRGSPALYAGIRLDLNRLAEKKLHYDKGKLEYLIEILQRNQPFGFQEEVLQWFHYPEKFKPEMQLEGPSERRRSRISELETWLEKKVEENANVGLGNWRSLCAEFSDKYERIPGEKLKSIDDTSRLVSTISRALKKLKVPYTFEKIDKSRDSPTWGFLKQKREQEDGQSLEYKNSQE